MGTRNFMSKSSSWQWIMQCSSTPVRMTVLHLTAPTSAAPLATALNRLLYAHDGCNHVGVLAAVSTARVLVRTTRLQLLSHSSKFQDSKPSNVEQRLCRGRSLQRSRGLSDKEA